MTKTKRGSTIARGIKHTYVSCYRVLATLLPSQPSPSHPLAIVRLPFSATPRDNERKLLLLMFGRKIRPVEASHATLLHAIRPCPILQPSPRLLRIFYFTPASSRSAPFQNTG